MNRKIFVMGIIGMFLLTSITGLSAIGLRPGLKSKIIKRLSDNIGTVNVDGDRLDQQQTECNNGLLLDRHSHPSNYKVYLKGIAQSFIPDAHARMITRVELYVSKIGTPPDNLSVGIRKFGPGEEWHGFRIGSYENLFETSTNMSPSEVSTTYKWIEFDFPDIKINKSCLYYILVTSKGNTTNCYSLGYFEGSDLYDKGKLGEFWAHPWPITSPPSCRYSFELFSAADLTFKTYAEMENQAPMKPSINGPTSGEVGKAYSYTAQTTDPEGDQLYYWFDWGDGTDSGWLGSYTSGQTASASHTWHATGDFSIRVKAKDDFDGAESPWSELIVSMPKNKESLSPLFIYFSEHFPYLRQLFQLNLSLRL